MGSVPLQLVPGAPRVPATFGLFSVVNFRDGSTDRWEGGVEFETLGCPPEGFGIADWQCEGNTLGLPKVFSAGKGLSAAAPFTLYGSYRCSPIGSTLQHAYQVAEERLLATEEANAELRLMPGDFTQTRENPKPFADATVIGAPTIFDIVTGVALIENEIAKGYGGQGVIHMSRLTATLALEKGVLEVRGGRLVTQLGTPTVAGVGYASGIIAGTPPIFGYRSDIFRSSLTSGDLLNKANNDLHAVAERTYVIGYEACGPWVVYVTDPSNGI